LTGRTRVRMATSNGRIVLVVLAVCGIFLFSSFSVPEAAGRLSYATDDAAELLMRTRQLVPEEREEHYRTAVALPVDDASPAPNAATAAAADALRTPPEPIAGRPVRDRPTVSAAAALGDVAAAATPTAVFDASSGCYGCNGGSRPGEVDPASGCGRVRRLYLYHPNCGSLQSVHSHVTHARAVPSALKLDGTEPSRFQKRSRAGIRIILSESFSNHSGFPAYFKRRCAVPTTLCSPLRAAPTSSGSRA